MEILLIAAVVLILLGGSLFTKSLSLRNRMMVTLFAGTILLIWVWFLEPGGEIGSKILISAVALIASYTRVKEFLSEPKSHKDSEPFQG